MASVTVGAAPVVTLSLNRPSSSSCAISRVSFSNSEYLGTPLSISTSSLTVSITPSPSTVFGIVKNCICGRGDRKTARGKRFDHSFGNARPRDKKKGRGPPRVPMPPSIVKKDRFDFDFYDYDKASIGINE